MKQKILINGLFFFFVCKLIASEINDGDSYALSFSSEKEEVFVSSESKFSFTFKDSGWIYLKNNKNNSFIRLLNEYYDDGVNFSFQTSKKQGIIRLTFTYQNAKDSREFSKNVILNIKKRKIKEKIETKEKPEKSRLAEKTINNTDLVEIIKRALNLSYINDYKGALALLNSYKTNDDKYISFMAELYYKDKNYSKAYENFLKLKNKYYNDIIFNLVDLGIKLHKKDEVLRDARYLIENNIDFNEEMYLDILEFLLENKEYEFSENFISLYKFKYMNPKYPDKYNYLLGNLYEADNVYRNYLKALSYYKTVIDNYPFSNYYEPSKARYLFLKRFF